MTNCLVTGRTSGIGKAAALELARRGASVIIVGRNAGRGKAAVAELRDSTGNDSVEFQVADLSSQQSVRALASAVERRYGKLHVLINNAGVVEPRHRLTEDGIDGVEGQDGLYSVNIEPVHPAPIVGNARVTADFWRESSSLVGLWMVAAPEPPAPRPKHDTVRIPYSYPLVLA